MGNIEHDGEQLMREQPTGEMLLQAARDALKNKVLPLLQGEGAADAKREVLMVMNAMSIAQRELQTGSKPDEEESASLSVLIGDFSCDIGSDLSSDLLSDGQAEPMVSITQANRELSARIRQGGADPGTSSHAAVLTHLRTVGRSRLQASNPKVLKAGKP